MNVSFVLIFMGLLILFSHVFSALFSKTKIPNVLILLLIGLVIGPVLGLVSAADFGAVGSVFTTITLTVILFQSGVTLNLSDLGKSMLSGTLVTIINFILAAAVGIFVGKVLLGLPILYAIFLGAALGGTSSAVVIPMVNQLKPSQKTGMTLFLESSLSDVLCLVISLALLAAIETGEVSVGGMFASMAGSIVFSILFGFALGLVWIVVLKKFLVGMDNSMFTTFALAFIVYGLADIIGWNGGLAILAFALTSANIGKGRLAMKVFNEEVTFSEGEKGFYSEIVFVFQTYFFVYIGINLKFGNIWHIVCGFIFIAALYALRYFVFQCFPKAKYSVKDKLRMFALGPKGLVAAVLASLPAQTAHSYAVSLGLSDGTIDALCAGSQNGPVPCSEGVTAEMIDKATTFLQAGEAIQNVAYACVLVSIVLSSLLVIFIERKPDIATETTSAVEATGDVEETSVAQE